MSVGKFWLHPGITPNMKQAKRRLLPTLAKLVGSAKRASRSITNILALVANSNLAREPA